MRIPEYFMSEEIEINGRKYRKNRWGGLSQTDAKPFEYNQEYNNTYESEEYKKASDRLMDIRISLVERVVGYYPTSLLDFGYGNGAFLDALSVRSGNFEGYDVADTDYHKDKAWNRVDDYKKWMYECVTFWDSLEHCEDPARVVQDIDAQTVCISLPWMPKGALSKWKHLKPDEHLHHFNRDSLITFMLECGYSPVKVGNWEDEVRKGNSPNILTGIFRRA